ncbi:MAG TPA: carboxypeptidase regulatory-like domain-containing protein [Terriglobales bacterium]|nr:carboxypeptidase regulatory-like domain-containing protein [Terriglobales bacterium]
MPRGFSFLSLVIVFALSAAHMYGQATATGTMQGTVMDQTQAVIAGASVRVVSKATGLSRSMVTNDSGSYRFDQLPAGVYSIRVEQKGFAPAVSDNVQLLVATTTNMDFTLVAGTQVEAITVVSEAPVLDSAKSDVGLAITPREIQDLPMNGRDFANLALLAPGAKPVDSYDPTKNRIAVFGINGSSGRNVNLTVNGVDNKDNTVGGPVMQFPLGAIQEFNISTQRFSAANGRSEGAAVNVITKSGSNDFHGDAFIFERNERLNANDYFSEQSHQAKSPFSRQQFGGSIGGPVRKDKDFLFFAIERQREITNIVADPTAVKELTLVTSLGAQPAANIPTPYRDWRYTGRFDHRINEANSLSMSYSNQNNRGLNDQITATSDLTGGNFTTNQLILANFTLSSVLNPHVVNSFTAGYQYWNNLIDSTLRVPTFTFPGAITFGTNTNVPQQSYQAKWQFRDDISITHGKHAFRTGFDYLWEPKLGGFFEFNPTLEIDFLDLPSVILSDKTLYPNGFATPGAVGSMSATAGNPYFNLPGGSKMFGVFFQDDWKISRNFTLNLGIRWDKDYNLIGTDAQPKNRTYEALKAIGSPYAGRLPHDDNKDFSPRIGFAWDLTGHARHILRGGYGIYFGQTFLNIPLFMIQQINPTIFATVFAIASSGPGDKNADTVPGTSILLSNWRFGVDPLPVIPPPPTAFSGGEVGRLMDPFYRNPYSQQWNIGYAYQLNNSTAIEVEYVHELGLHESKTVNANPKRTARGGARQLTAAFKAAGLPVLGRVDVEQAIGRSRYDGLNVSYRRRMSRRFSVNTNYVFSRALAYNGFSAAFRNRATDVDHIFAAHDLGPTPNDERHRWVASGIVDLPWGFIFAPIVQWAGARPYAATQGIDVYGFGTGIGSTHAIVTTANPKDLTATKSLSAASLRACLTAGSCYQVPYDNLRGKIFFQLDTRVSKTVKLGERARLELIFQAFDLTNRANFGNNYVGNIRSSQFMQPNGFITPSGVIVPRSFSGEIGAQFRF